nr:hypothetical protein [Stenotrophomonas sepilia]
MFDHYQAVVDTLNPLSVLGLESWDPFLSFYGSGSTQNAKKVRKVILKIFVEVRIAGITFVQRIEVLVPNKLWKRVRSGSECDIGSGFPAVSASALRA